MPAESKPETLLEKTFSVPPAALEKALGATLARKLWSNADEKRLQDAVAAEVAAAVAEAEKAPPPAISPLFEDVYAAKPPHLDEQKQRLLALEGDAARGEGAFPL